MINTATDLLVREVNLDLTNGNDSAPIANAPETSRFLKGLQVLGMAGIVTTVAALKFTGKDCKLKFPEIELPQNVTQAFIDEFDYRNDLRHNCEKQKENIIFWTAIVYTTGLSIVNLAQRTSCLSTIGSMPARILSFFRGSNREGVELQNLSGSDREMQNLTPVFPGSSVPPTLQQLNLHSTNTQTETGELQISISPHVTFSNIHNADQIETQPNSRSV